MVTQRLARQWHSGFGAPDRPFTIGGLLGVTICRGVASNARLLSSLPLASVTWQGRDVRYRHRYIPRQRIRDVVVTLTDKKIEITAQSPTGTDPPSPV